MLLELVECYYCLWNVTIACGMLLLLVERNYCLWNVTIACGMLLLRVECYYRLWNATIACGMLTLLVECYYCLWNVASACGMLFSKFSVRDATPAGLAHTPHPTPPHPYMKIYENPWGGGVASRILNLLSKTPQAIMTFHKQ